MIPPPKIAFVASNVTGSPDALTVGPMAGRLGAPLFITSRDSLSDATSSALANHSPDLVIVAGGPNTITDTVLEQIATATGLDTKEFDDKPATGIIRAFGFGRDQTAAKLAELLDNYNPKFLPTDATALGAVDAANAANADLLDGFDSSDVFAVPLLPGDAVLSGGAEFRTTSVPGIRMLDGGSNPIVGWMVQLPADFPSGGTLTGTLLYSSPAGGCTFDLSLGSIALFAPSTTSRKPSPAMTVPGSINGTGNVETVNDFAFSVEGSLEPGDLVWMALSRSLAASDDTCLGAFTIHGGELNY